MDPHPPALELGGYSFASNAHAWLENDFFVLAMRNRQRYNLPVMGAAKSAAHVISYHVAGKTGRNVIN